MRLKQETRKPRICFVGPMLGNNSNWVPNPMETLAPFLEERGYVCFLTSRVVNRYLRLLDMVLTLVRKRKYFDLVCLQVYSGPSVVVEEIVSWLAKVLGKPLVMVLHGGAMPDFMKRFPRWSKRVMKRADKIVAPSSYLSDAVASYGFSAEVIPNILPLEMYHFRHRNRVEPKLLWMRTFYEYYNPDMAIEVFRKILQRFPNALLTMAGQDKGLLEPTKAKVKNAGLEHNVRFPGFLDSEMKKQEFCSHDIFLNTTRIDNMPICLLEAGASGLPIVSTCVGGVPHLVADEESALLVPSDDADAMTKSILRLIDSPRLADRLSLSGRKLAERSDSSKVIPMWEKVFDHFTHSG